MLKRCTKNKQVGRIQLFGDDDVFKANANSAYNTSGSSFTNGKILKFFFKRCFKSCYIVKKCKDYNRICIYTNCHKYD